MLQVSCLQEMSLKAVLRKSFENSSLVRSYLESISHTFSSCNISKLSKNSQNHISTVICHLIRNYFAKFHHEVNDIYVD